MSKSAKEVALEAKLAKAQAGSETAVYDAQVEVYEGQVTEARDAYTEAKAKRGKARAKLPEEIPDESFYKERLLEAQYSRGRARTQGELEHVDNFVTGITEQQEAKKTIKVLDEQMPALLSSAEKEVETTNKQIETARKKEIANQMSLITGLDSQIFAERTRVYNEASATNTKAIETEKKRVAKQIDDFNKAEALRVSVLNKAEDARVNTLRLADNKLVADALSFVKADQKVKADLAFKAETKRLADLAVKEEKQRVKQEVIDKNKIFFDSGGRFGKSGSKEIHYAKLSGVPTLEGEVKYYDGGKFTLSYYERAGKQMGITTEQARKVSDAGRMSQSGKARDRVLRSFQDPTGASEALYQEHRRLAGKVTASAQGAQKIKDAQASGKNTSTDIYGSASLMGTNVKAPQGSILERIQTAKQTQRSIDLREGNVGIATGLLEPVTSNTYSKTGEGSALSLTKKFLVERGYDLDNLDVVPNSVFTTPVKYVEARKQAGSSGQMGDLRTLVPKSETEAPIGKVDEVMVGSVTTKTGTVQVGNTTNEYFKTEGGTLNEYFAPIPSDELVKRQEARARQDAYDVLASDYKKTLVQEPRVFANLPTVKTLTVPVTTYKFNGVEYTSKSELTDSVKARNKSMLAEATFNTEKNQLLNKGKSEFTWGDTVVNKSGTLNKDGGVKTVKPVSTDRLFTSSDVQGTKYGGQSLTGAISTKQSKNESMLNEAKYGHVNAKFNYMKNKSGTLNPEGYIKGYVAPQDPKDRLFTSSDVLPTSYNSRSLTGAVNFKQSTSDGKLAEAQSVTDQNNILNKQSNVSGKLNPESVNMLLPHIEKKTDEPVSTSRVFTSSDVKPTTYTFNGIAFTDQDKLKKYVRDFKSGNITAPVSPTPVPVLSGSTLSGTVPPLLIKKPFDISGFDPIASQVGTQWTVTTVEKTKVPTMSGSIVTVDAPVPNTFDTEIEADLFIKSQKQNVFSGTDNDTWNKFNYRSAVLTGEVPHPSTTPSWNDDARFYANAILDPVKTVGYGVANLVLPEDKKIPVYESGSGQLIGGTIEDVMSGDPLKGTGVKNAWEYVKADPIGTALELPAEAVMWVAGGKAVQGITKGAVAVKSTLAVSKVIPQPLKTVGTKIESGVKAVQKTPENIWLKGTEASTTLKSIDKTIANVGGQRVGLTTAMNLRYTLGGRKFLREAKDRSFEVNPQPKFGEVGLFDKLSNDPVNIVNKNIIDIPKQASDEGIVHLRGNIVTDSPVVKVGNVQQYYKSATPSFTNVPRQGLQFPKAPKLPSLDSARNWITKTKQNVKRVEQGGYKAMLSGGNTKLKAVEKGMKAKDNILDAKHIARDEIKFAKEDLSILTKQKMIKYSDDSKQMKSEVTESAKKTLVNPISKAKRTDNDWGKLSRFKAETKDKLRRKKESITDRPATQDVILYRQSGTTTGTDSIIKSMPEGLSVKATPIKTVRTQTATPTDYTTGLAKETTFRNVFENKTPVLFTGKVDKGIPIIGEQVKIPYKDLKGIEKMKGSEERLFDIGSYPTLEKGKLVQKKLEVKALQQEDADKTLIQRNTLTGTGEKIQESSVREWGGQRSDVILGSLEKKVLTTKLSPLPKKDIPKVIDRRMTQNDRTSQWTGSSDSGNPMTGKGRSNTSTIDEIGTYDPRTGTTTIPKINAVSSPVKGKAKSVMKEYSSTLKSAKSPYNSAYVGGAIGEVTFTSSILTPKDMIKTGVDTNSASITGVQGKIDTSMRQDSVQKLNADTASRLNTRSGIRSKLNIKLDTGLKTGQMTTTAQIPLLKTPTYSRQQTPKVLPIILPREKLKEKTRRGKKGKKAGFIGNVRLDNIMGMYKRKEITYGEKKVTKLERQDARLTSGTSNRISMPASGLLKTKKKKKKKKTSIFGGGKDEFAGFESKTKKKKGKKKTKKKVKRSITKRFL